METFKKNLFRIYTRGMCVVALVCGVGYLAAGFYDLAIITQPDLFMPRQMAAQYRDNAAFVEAHYKSDLHQYLTDKQITTQRLAGLDQARRERREEGIRGLLVSLAVLAVCAGVFIVHRRGSRAQYHYS